MSKSLLDRAFPGEPDPFERLSQEELTLEIAHQLGTTILELDPVAVNESWHVLKFTTGWSDTSIDTFSNEIAWQVEEKDIDRLTLLGKAVEAIVSGPLDDEIAIGILAQLRAACIGWNGRDRATTGQVFLEYTLKARNYLPTRRSKEFYREAAKNMFTTGSDFGLRKLLRGALLQPPAG